MPTNLALCLWMLATGTLSELRGTLVDATTNNPVADALVTLTGPSINGSVEVVTASDGAYVLPRLSPGTYELRFEKEGYELLIRPGIVVRDRLVLRLNADLMPLVVPETIVVNVSCGGIDVGSSSTGVIISTDFIRHAAGLMRPRGGM